MDSRILNDMGLGGIDAGIIVIAVAALTLVTFVLCVVFLAKYTKLKKRYEKFMQGNTARSLEADIVRLYEDVKYVKLSTEKNRKDIAVLFEKALHAFQKAGLVKYDAFNQMGGKLSFCLALLDEENNGYVINSVHGGEGCYTYSKEIRGGASAIHLGDEEEEALDMAMKGGPVK